MERENEKASALKHDIIFRIEPSALRKNVHKHVVRCVLKNYSKFKKDVLISFSNHGINMEKYGQSCDTLKLLCEYEKRASHLKDITKEEKLEQIKRGKTYIKCDHKNILNQMLAQPEMQIIMYYCIRHSLRLIKGRILWNIKMENVPIYVTTLEDYMAFIRSKVENIPPQVIVID